MADTFFWYSEDRKFYGTGLWRKPLSESCRNKFKSFKSDATLESERRSWVKFMNWAHAADGWDEPKRPDVPALSSFYGATKKDWISARQSLLDYFPGWEVINIDNHFGFTPEAQKRL